MTEVLPRDIHTWKYLSLLCLLTWMTDKVRSENSLLRYDLLNISYTGHIAFYLVKIQLFFLGVDVLEIHARARIYHCDSGKSHSKKIHVTIKLWVLFFIHSLYRLASSIQICQVCPRIEWHKIVQTPIAKVRPWQRAGCVAAVEALVHYRGRTWRTSRQDTDTWCFSALVSHNINVLSKDPDRILLSMGEALKVTTLQV
jgi:hypothetical protein